METRCQRLGCFAGADILASLLALLLAIPAFSQQGSIEVGRYLGLNDSDSPAVIGDEAQDALNVESNLEGTAILKRKGYSREASLTVATAPVTGYFSLTCDSGDRLDIVCHDRYCAKSTNGGAFANFLSTGGGSGSVPTRWSFVTIDGDLYGANDSRDPVLKYDCTTLTYPIGPSAGSLLALSEDRMIVTDTSANPNRVYYSKSGDYTNHTTGVESEDAYFDDIGTAGDRITGVNYGNGTLHLFKRGSITGCLLDDQYTSRCAPISNVVGTQDPLSIVEGPKGLYFKAQDRTYWLLGQNGLEPISKKIANFVKNQATGASRSNTQTTQADWENGVQTPLLSWNTTTAAGSVFASSVTFVDASSTSFALGSCLGCGTTPRQDISFAGVTSTYVFRYDADVLPAADSWTKSFAGTESVAGSSLTLSVGNDSGKYTKGFTATGSSKFMVFRAASGGSGPGYLSVGFDEASSGAIQISSAAIHYYNIISSVFSESVTQPSYSTFTVIVSTPTNSISFWRNGVFKASATHTADVSTAKIGLSGGITGTTYGFIDFVHVSSGVPSPGVSDIVSIATATSRIFNTAFTTPTFAGLTITSYPITGTTLAYSIRTSTSPNDDLWGSYESISNGKRPQSYANQYVQYRATFTALNLTDSPGIGRVELPAATTGQYRTQCVQPGSGITSWGIMSCAETKTGAGSLVYYTTTAASCAALPSTPPLTGAGVLQSGWTAETNNATVTASTNAAIYIGFRSLLGSATDQAQVDACTLYWNEGTTAQPVWGVYDTVRNAIYWTGTSTSSTTSDRVLKYDLNLEQFYPMGLNATALGYFNNSVYFGSSNGGYWNRLGLTDSDNGSAINAYWKSRDFYGASPFVESTYQKISIMARNQVTGSMTATYSTSNNLSTSYTVSLATTTGIPYARSNYNTVLSSPANFINIRLGNNSATPFEVLGMRIEYFSYPWRVVGP